MRELSWGIIGCGDVVLKKSGPSIFRAERSCIAGVMRRDVDKARPFAAANGIALCTADAGQVIGHPDVDVVYVATPPSSHREYVLAAAAAGKHVLVEKPMGMSADDDRAMIDACGAAGVELFVAYYRRFQPHVLAMKELIDAGRIGRPVMGQIDFAMPAPGQEWGWRLCPEISGGGLFVDIVAHRLDLMVYLLGAPEDVHGLGDTFGCGALTIRFADGALCTVAGDFVSDRTADRFMIVGTEGTICAEKLDSHRFTLSSGGAVETLEFEPLPAPHLGLIRHIERVLNGDGGNASSGEDGRLTDVLIDEGLGRGKACFANLSGRG
ncbi:MAG: Gfo/Idh/MocA family oxidoreductase [Lentisphaerae bacterium]|jgi:predicted dehydrogenase|nr:Gfo/Idh/MocA family oxidoreductase [Lentisphaerota bacterium]MBT4816379.1 Gfo/Idh/MocA family oxidoreductase [Lentisphaerota bacterium]MBT5606669.1 Gfo/Idh/MocA family oxidoreductase [Lentisphaerota bacterium]MBT7059816.1 Gfo/Idh/MocA family oxidoreductase [Lentisphaerota bacterium]MBT7847341.1 Gfo/Idh/MocA family oxidoreductase [Lentisphaerota bacterium]